MSKLTFRARALDCIKRLSLYRKEQLPDLAEYAANQRSVPAMPSGMEKEEEMELHLQQVISARQSISKPIQSFELDVSIPIPRVETERNRYEGLYRSDFMQPKRFIAVQSSNTDPMDYDMDSDDEVWFQTFGKKFELKPEVFGHIMGSLEKRCQYNMVITLEEARALFNEPPEVVDELYSYWLNKRKTGRTLIPQVLTDNRDVSLMAYIAFRRRKEKIATRKYRKTEQDTIVRGKLYKQAIDAALLSVADTVNFRDMLECSFICEDIDTIRFCARHGEWKIGDLELLNLEWHSPALLAKQNEICQRRRPKKVALFKTEAEKSATTTNTLAATRRKAQLPLRDAENKRADRVDVRYPDGRFTFRRRKNCVYHPPASSSTDRFTACSRETFYPVHLRSHLVYEGSDLHFAGFCRRRRSRGGRIVFDRIVGSIEDNIGSTNGSIFNVQGDIRYRPQALTADDKADIVCELSFLMDPNGKKVDVVKCNQSAVDLDVSVEFGIRLPAQLDDASSVIASRINTVLRKRKEKLLFSEPHKKRTCHLTVLDAEMSQLAVQAVERSPRPTVCFPNEGTPPPAPVYSDGGSYQPDAMPTSELPHLREANSPAPEALPECTPPLKRQTADGSYSVALDRVRKPPSYYYASVEKCQYPPASTYGPLSASVTSVNIGGTYRNTTVSSPQNMTNFKNVVSVDHGNYVSFSPAADRDIHPVLVNGATSSAIMSQQNGNGSFSNTGSVDPGAVAHKPSQTESCSTSVTPYRFDCSPFGCMADSTWNNVVHKTGKRFKYF